MKDSKETLEEEGRKEASEMQSLAAVRQQLGASVGKFQDAFGVAVSLLIMQYPTMKVQEVVRLGIEIAKSDMGWK